MVNFDKEFAHGAASYDRSVGTWWKKRAESGHHKYAYKKIAAYIAEQVKNPPFILDYACGTGDLLAELMKAYPKTQFFGLDGSKLMLGEAAKKTDKQRIHFIETTLPNFSLPQGVADVVVFNFPNIVPHPEEQPYYDKNGYKHKEDKKVARYLAKAREPDPEDETVTDDVETVMDVLLTNKVISRNLRKLVKTGGYCIRTEYANAPREELTKLVLQRTMFEEGSLGEDINGVKPEQLFEIVAAKFFKSKVIEDVYHQTKDPTDKEGGYYVVVMKAV